MRFGPGDLDPHFLGPEECEFLGPGFLHKDVLEDLSCEVVAVGTAEASVGTAHIAFDLSVIVGSLYPIASIFQEMVGTHLVSDPSEDCSAEPSGIDGGFLGVAA